MWKPIAVGICLVAITAVALWQGRIIRDLRKQAPAKIEEPARPADEPRPAPAREAPRRDRGRAVAAVDEELNQRVAVLEKTVAQLTDASEYLMSRGQLPLAAHKRAELEAKVMDP